MSISNIEAGISEKIKQEIISAWREGHGGTADKVHMFQSDEGMVLLIPGAFYQAEINLYNNSAEGDKVLNQYLSTLLHSVASGLVPMLEENTKQTIGEVIPLVDLFAGWAIAFYRYE